MNTGADGVLGSTSLPHARLAAAAASCVSECLVFVYILQMRNLENNHTSSVTSRCGRRLFSLCMRASVGRCGVDV